MVGLPSIQPVDEYNVRYGAATKEEARDSNLELSPPRENQPTRVRPAAAAC